ncbi:MAG: DUF3048 domain-containing protein [Oscillospiraceae bacterium]|nr:DUF3048 domain-containing protein [Oscillospiraceae bacterium]
MALILLAALLASTVAMAAPLTSNPVTMPESYSTGAFASNITPEGKSPTTGLDVGDAPYRPVLVTYSNEAAARPQYNLSEADIVYEAIYWGPAHTRYIALFNDNHPELVLSVRSLRWHMAEWRQEWDCPIIFFGGQVNAGYGEGSHDDRACIKCFFIQQNVDNQFLWSPTIGPRHDYSYNSLAKEGGKGIFRYNVTKRPSPNNAGANVKWLVENAWPTNEDGTPYEPKNHAFKFSTTPTSSSDIATEIYVEYNKNYFPSYTYNAAERVYERWYNGEEQYDGATEKRIVASNVIIQFCEVYYIANDAARPMTTTTKDGVMDAFIDGKHIRGSWVRQALSDRTVFLDMNGEEIALLPGKTFIQVIPLSSKFTYKNGAGEMVTLDYGTEVAAAYIDQSLTSEDEMDLME